jgi:RNA-directed DNA polymerase
MTKKKSDWEEYLVSKEIIGDELNLYLEYVETLLNNNVPVIFDILHLSKLVGIDLQNLSRIINSQSSFYRNFSIPKRSHGKRTISMPYPTLLYIQRWIKDNILDKIIIHDSAHGFIKGRSVITNANVHVKNKTMLKMDISDFFPSINLKRVISIFRRLGYSNKISFYLAVLCTLDNSLPQGAATSPVISNIISNKLDNRLNKLATASNLTYSRYADDLVFSGKFISYKYISIIKKILKEEGFNVNNSKTRLITGNGKKIITGVSISTHSLKLPKSTKRIIRREGYYLSKYPQRYINKIHEDPFFVDRIIGKYNFWLQIEPNNKYAQTTITKLKTISNYLHEYV